jgi:hypothetical protein
MIKRTFVISCIWACLTGLALGQPVQDLPDELSIEDLKPRINYAQSDPFYQPLREKSGYALLSSAIVPGAGQAANDKWLRAGLYFIAEAILVGVHIKSFNDARAEQRRYKQFANKNWSVVNYAKWLVNYHEQNNLSNKYISELRDQVSGTTAEYHPQKDWDKIDIELLREVERNTPFVYSDQNIGNNFSHVMPDYGSQQYYELISKYYQYGSGWNDFGEDTNGNNLDSRYRLSWDGSDMPFNFVTGAALAEDFNDSYRLAGNMVSLLILNHIVSAFDAFLTVKLKNSRLEAETNFINPEQTFSLKFHF